MTKDEARKILEDWLSNQIPEGIKIDLPIVDEVIYTKTSFDVKETAYQQWTFLGLIKLLYDLEDRK